MKSKAVSVEQPRIDMKRILQSVGTALLAFLFGAARLLGAVSPLGTAIVGALPAKYLLPGAAGAIVGAVLFAPAGRMAYLIAVTLLLLGARLALGRLIRRKMRPGFLCLVTMTCTSICAIVSGILNRVPAADFLLLAIEIMLASSFTYFFALSGEVLLRKRQIPIQSYAQKASLCVLFICVVCSAANISLFGVNLGVLLGVVAILAAISRYGILGGCFCTVMTAVALNLYSMDMLKFTGLLIAAAFIAGAFSPLGKFGTLSAFLAVSVFGLFLLGAPLSLAWRLVDTFLACAIFILLPTRLIRRSAGEAASSLRTNQPSGSQQTGFASKLAFASGTIRDLEEELSAVSEKFSAIDYNNIGTIYDAVASTVCKGCARSLSCWEKNSGETLDAFNPVSDILRISGAITPETLPPYFKENCCKVEPLCRGVTRYYETFVARQDSKRQAAESRRIVFEQFDSIADMLLEVSEEVGDVTGFDETMTRAVSTVYEKLEKEPEQIICPVDRFGRSRVEIYTSEVLRTSPAVLSETISTAAGREFSLPSVSHTQGMTRLSLFEKARYGVEFSAQQSCYGDNSVCGDTSDYFTDAQGYIYLLMSDGMGSGKRAAIDSVMTCSILGKLIKAGFGMSASIRLLNSSLLVKSTDESLATIDLCRIDLYTGRAEFYKAGAATTFVWSKNEITRIESGSLPVGILEGAGADKQELRLREGDIVLMVSDGALGAGEGWLAETIRQSTGRSAKELAVSICEEAKRRTREVHPDDITVLAAKLCVG